MLFTPPVLADHLNQALTINGQTSSAGIFPPSRKFIFRVIDVRSLAFARAFSRWPRSLLSTPCSQPSTLPYFPTNFTGRPGRAAVSCPSRITGTPFTTTSEKPAA